MALIVIILIIMIVVINTSKTKALKNVNQQKESLESDIAELNEKKTELESKLRELDGFTYLEIKEKINDLQIRSEELDTVITNQSSKIEQNDKKIDSQGRQIESQANKLRKEKELYKAMQYSIQLYEGYDPNAAEKFIDDYTLNIAEEYSPTVMANLHSMDSKSLRKAYRENEKQIDSVLKKYAARYTTKANKAIYQLMVIALRAELQNILLHLKYDKLEDAVANVENVTDKYLKIAGEGNQSIAGTLTKFIGEIKYLFTNAVKIEYNYYVKREQAKQEQGMLREQMKQEREERKALELERKKVEAEEQKYQKELIKIKEQITLASEADKEKLQARLLELEQGLTLVATKKEEIANLAKGKAGYVYIISNIGSFGENVFKIGMTRRTDPEDRVNELGSASVPFKFDIHSTIFSQDAVALENELHKRLSDKRVNKVNMRKEFFRISLDELESLVYEIDPTAEFKAVVTAEEYNQSLSSDGIYTSEISFDNEEDDE